MLHCDALLVLLRNCEKWTFYLLVVPHTLEEKCITET